MRITQWLTTLVMVTGFGAGAVWMLLPGEADRLREANERLERERFELQRAIQRLTGEDRVAEVHVIDQVLAGPLTSQNQSPSPPNIGVNRATR